MNSALHSACLSFQTRSLPRQRGRIADKGSLWSFSSMQLERRDPKNRRRKPTPILSRYTFSGRRTGLRRKEDQERGGYVDRYNSTLLILVLAIIGLNVLDSLFTTMILDFGGWEVNPIVRSAIEAYGDHFWIWKFFLVSANVILLCLHSKFRHVPKIILTICGIYLGVVAYQVMLMRF